MQLSEPFVTVLMIFQESIKLLPKNGKLMAFIMIVPTLLSSLTFSIFYFSIKSMLVDMLAREPFRPISSSNSLDFSTILPGLNQNFIYLLDVYVFFILALSIITLYTTIATILLAASSYRGTTLSFKDLALLTKRAWRRQYVTRLYISLFATGYIVFVLLAASPVLIFFGNSMADAFPSVVGIAACIGYLYLMTVWVLGIVISVIEENCYGIEALGRAERLLGGKRTHGFILNIMYTLLAVVLFGGLSIIRGHKWLVEDLAKDLIIWLVVVIFTCLLNLFYMMGYTVLYFQCKKKHGEEIEFQGEVENSKMASNPLSIVLG